LRYHSFSETDAILKSLDGFEFKIFDESGVKLVDYKVDYSQGHHGKSFNENKPLSLWLESNLAVNKNSTYKLVLNIPPRRTTDSAFAKPVLVGGIGERVSL